MNAEVPLRAPPPLLDTVDLAQPLEAARRAVYLWAGQSGQAVFDVAQLEHLGHRFAAGHAAHGASGDRDIQVAIGALQGLERRPEQGFAGYVEVWEAQRLSNQVFNKGDFGRLRELRVQLGGILLNSPSEPFVLLLPQPDGSWVQMGWEAVLQFDGSPLGADRERLHLLAEHQLPHGQRTFVEVD